MRQIGTLSQEAQAKKFAAFLLTKGVRSNIEIEDAAWEIWIRDEDQVDLATAELAKFQANPNAPLYRGVETKAESITREELEHAKRVKRNIVEMRSNWRNPLAAKSRPLTIVLVVLCVAVAFMTNMGQSRGSMAYRALLFTDPAGYRLNDEQTAGTGMAATFASIRRGEIWRLITPVFLHGGSWHLIFNMFMLYHFGSQIESVYGSWKIAILILAIALVSNLAQAIFVGPNFVGISGVVYGLFGFAWMKATFEPARGIFVGQLTVIILVGWFLAGVFGLLKTQGLDVANWAHGGGLFAGLMIGYLPLWIKEMGRRR